MGIIPLVDYLVKIRRYHPRWYRPWDITLVDIDLPTGPGEKGQRQPKREFLPKEYARVNSAGVDTLGILSFVLSLYLLLKLLTSLWIHPNGEISQVSQLRTNPFQVLRTVFYGAENLFCGGKNSRINVSRGLVLNFLHLLMRWSKLRTNLAKRFFDCFFLCKKGLFCSIKNRPLNLNSIGP